MSNRPEPLYRYVSPPSPTESAHWFAVKFDRITPALPDGTAPDGEEITVSRGVLERIQTGDLARPLSLSDVRGLDGS